jgi:RNA recognition motif-containing protein
VQLPYSVAWQDLKDLFRKVGDVIRADVMERDGRSKGCGTVLFSHVRDVDEAICKLFFSLLILKDKLYLNVVFQLGMMDMIGMDVVLRFERYVILSAWKLYYI